MHGFRRIEHFLGKSKVYKAFFKAAFALIASALLTIGQFGPELYKKDLEAHQLKFKAEFAMKQPINKHTDCSKVEEHQILCQTALHHMKTLDAALNIWEFCVKLILYLGVTLFTLSGVCFLTRLFKPIPKPVIN